MCLEAVAWWGSVPQSPQGHSGSGFQLPITPGHTPIGKPKFNPISSKYLLYLLLYFYFCSYFLKATISYLDHYNSLLNALLTSTKMYLHWCHWMTYLPSAFGINRQLFPITYDGPTLFFFQDNFLSCDNPLVILYNFLILPLLCNSLHLHHHLSSSAGNP